jgi:hypothetical protein
MDKMLVVGKAQAKGKGFWKSALPVVAGVGVALVAGVAMASSGGPFADFFNNFLTGELAPSIGAIGVAGGVIYGGIHAFKHDYGKAGLGLATAAGGGFVIHQFGWFGQQAGVSAATLGGHVAMLSAFAHALGL